jgi:hypothetical protein
MKKFTIRIEYDKGFSIEDVEEKSFAKACLKLEKLHNKLFHAITKYELINIQLL